MQRVTITIDDELLAALDRMIATRGYQNRSEAIRDLARAEAMKAEGSRASRRRRTRGRGGAGLCLPITKAANSPSG